MRLILGPLVSLLSRLKYGVRIERFASQGGRPYLILFNHQTPYDQFFVMAAFKGPVYYLATEDIFSNGFISKVISWVAAPIPIRKQTFDTAAVRTVVRVAREGGTIALAPEGNRTFSGKTEYINPSIAKLAKLLKLPVALFRIEGGYGVEPRWSDKTRRGRMRAYVSEVIEPEGFGRMTNDELYERICEGLSVNEARDDALFKSSRTAEYLERAIYVCPFCGFAVFHSEGCEIECQSCHRRIRYGEDKRLSGVGFDFPFAFVNDWYEYQKEFINRADNLKEFRDEGVCVSEVIACERKIKLYKEAALDLKPDHVAVTSEGTEVMRLPFEEVEAAAVLGRRKLNIYHGGKIYQFKGQKRFNALKYVHYIYHYRNQQKSGGEHGDFLGL